MKLRKLKAALTNNIQPPAYRLGTFHRTISLYGFILRFNSPRKYDKTKKECQNNCKGQKYFEHVDLLRHESLTSPPSDWANTSSLLHGVSKLDKYDRQPPQHQTAPAAVTNVTLTLIISYHIHPKKLNSIYTAHNVFCIPGRGMHQ